MRGDVGEHLHFDIAARVAAAIEKEPQRNVTNLDPRSTARTFSLEKMPFWHKARPWAAQITQVGVAACFPWLLSLAFSTITNRVAAASKVLIRRSSTPTCHG